MIYMLFLHLAHIFQKWQIHLLIGRQKKKIKTFLPQWQAVKKKKSLFQTLLSIHQTETRLKILYHVI